MKTALVIPAYNEEAHIKDVVDAARHFVDLVIVVNDGSKDRTSEILTQYTKTVSNVLALRHRTNLGKGGALKTGYEAALRLGYECLVTIDADGQHPPELISTFTTPIINGEVDAVFAYRDHKDPMPFVRKAGNRMINLCTRWFFGMHLRDVWCGFRAFSAEVYKDIHWVQTDYSGEIEVVLKMGRKQIRYKEEPIPTIYLDAAKGVDILHGLKLLARIFWWRLGLL